MPRHFLPLLLVAVLPALAAAAEPPARRPNVLWICSDDHAAYVAGCYGNAVVRTPNIDRLAAGGMRFDRAYCNSPICTASRASFLTGRYPRTVGVTLLESSLPEKEQTLGKLLRDAGYDTAYFGKIGINNETSHGFAKRLDLKDVRDWLRARGGPKPLPAGVAVQPPWHPFRDPARVWLNAADLPADYVDADSPATFFTESAEQYLAAHRDRPFFLMVGYYEPHSPFRYPVEFRGRHDPATFTVPWVGPEDEDQVPKIFRDLSGQDKQGIQAAYYTSVEYLDGKVGRLLQALGRLGLADDTIVIYIGDHGYQLGQHGRFEKHCMYEESVRAPLLIRYPPAVKPGSSTSAQVEFLDILPTVLDLCGVETPKDVQGRCLTGLLRGQTDRHREQVFVEYGHSEEAMVRDGRYKCVFIRGKRERDDGYATGRPLPGNVVKLFDERDDPGEFTNLAGRPGHRGDVDRYLALLVEHMKRTARLPEHLPATSDPLEFLDFCVQPRDAVPKPPAPAAAGKRP
jgi:choline-sulfatase